MQSKQVDRLITIMQLRLDEIRNNLLKSEIDKKQISGFYEQVKSISFTKISTTDEQRADLENLKKQYLKLFALYI